MTRQVGIKRLEEDSADVAWLDPDADVSHKAVASARPDP